MKVQLYDRTYVDVLQCFICNKSRICYNRTLNLTLVRCTFKGKCNLKNLYNNKIFNL